MKGENTYKAIMACLAWLFGSLGCANGQEVLKIEGCVRDSLGNVVPYATVALWQGPGAVVGQALQGAADSLELVGGSVTDTSGYYSLEVPEPGRYLLQCKHIVYRSVWQEAEIGSGSAGELDFVLAPDGEMLEEVRVEGSRIRFTAGEYKINLSESSVVKNRTMSEALNLLPGLVYKDGKLSLDGQAVSIIYLDGRELQSAEQLRWLNGEDIENVEVQNRAGSAYSSTLRGGIVRIETRRKEGYSLDLILNPYYGPSAKRADGYGGSFILPFFLRTGKFSLSNEASYRHHTGDAIQNEDAAWHGEGYGLSTVQRSRLRYNTFKDYLTMAYEIDERKTVGLVGAVYYSPSRNRIRSASHPVSMPEGTPGGLGYEESRYSLDENSKNLSYLLAVDYSQVFDSLGSRLSVKADYLYNSLKSDGLYRMEWLDGEAASLGEEVYRQHTPLTENNTTARLDYSHVFRPGRALNVGMTYDGKFAADGFRTETWRGGAWQDDPEQSGRYGIQTNQATAYAIYKDSHGKFSYSVGASVQWDGLLSRDAAGNRFSNRNYVQPFANVSLGYQFNPQRGTSLNLDLSRYSGGMPAYKQFSPRAVRLTENIYTVGNDKLRLPTGYSASLTYMLRGQWRFVYGFSAGNGNIYNITTYDQETGITWQSPRNGNWEYGHDLRASWDKEITDWLYMGLMVGGIYLDQSYSDVSGNYRHETVVGLASANLNFQILPTLGIGLNLYYTSPMSMIGEKTNHDLTGNISVYKTFCDGNLYMGLEGYFRGWDVVVTARELDGSYQNTIRYYNPFVQSLYLTLRWRFSRNSQDFKLIRATQRIGQ